MKVKKRVFFYVKLEKIQKREGNTSNSLVKTNYWTIRSLLLSSLLLITTGFTFDFLGGLLDDTDGDGLFHVSDGESSKWSVGGESLDNHWLCWGDLNHSGFTRFDELWSFFKNLEGSLIDFGDKFAELAGNIGGVTMNNWAVSRVDLTWVVEDNNLGDEILCICGWGVLIIGGDITPLDLLY